MLQREVAIKIPHLATQNQTSVLDLYLSEARAIAGLDHPNILPVYKAAKSVDIPCYIVTKYIDGCNLMEWVNQKKLDWHQIAELVSVIANAVGYAHRRGVVHRDIKPGNILVDREGVPMLPTLD